MYASRHLAAEWPSDQESLPANGPARLNVGAAQPSLAKAGLPAFAFSVFGGRECGVDSWQGQTFLGGQSRLCFCCIKPVSRAGFALNLSQAAEDG